MRHVPHLAALWAAVLVSTLLFAWSNLQGETAAHVVSERGMILVSADMAQDWADARPGTQVWMLRGRCRIEQGETTLTARKMVLWLTTDPRTGKRTRLQAYLEDDVRWDRPGQSLAERALTIDLETQSGVQFQVPRRLSDQPGTEDVMYQRALTARGGNRKSTVRTVAQSLPGERDAGVRDLGPELQPQQLGSPVTGVRRIRIFQRSSIPYNVYSFESKNTTPPEQVWILSGGVNILIDGLDQVGTVDLSADRIVIWTQTAASGDFTTETLQSRDTPLQIYLEGNIEGRQGDHELYASRAFYDAREERAIMLNAELKIHAPQLPLALRIRAEELRQLSKSSFHAQNAWISTSRFGKPGYRLQSSDVFFEERAVRPGSRPPVINPQTGVPEVETVPWATTLNTTFLVDDVPLFYWPYLSAPANDSGTPLRRFTVQTDRIFGTQVRTTWDLFKIFGREAPPGTRLDLLADYLSERGPAVGLNGAYEGSNLLGMPGDYFGNSLAYYVHDDGTDNLGADRRSLAPPNNDRGRLQLRHRQDMPGGFTLIGEVGYLSDRNFLEQYFENEFDKGKDNETLLYLKQQQDNWAWSVMGKAQVNDFDTTTQWLPKGDLYVLGEPLANGLFNWSTHSSAGYAKLGSAQAPTNPNDLFSPLPYTPEVEGAVLMTRHELSMPLSLGPVNITPYVLGEAAYWSEDMTGNDLGRLYGSAGVRASILFSKVFPDVQSSVLGLRGLAHKMSFDADYSFSDSSADLSQIPQYNEFDDQAQLRFRNRLLVNTFGGVLPAQFDPRFYGVRTGAAHNVTAPYNELVDDQQVLRLGWRHRLQTKAGPYENPRIVDWMTLDLEASYYPDKNRDNFGESFGLLSGRYAWNVSERTTFLANALYDTGGDSQKLWNLGILSQRSTRGSLYVGYRQVAGGPLDSQILTASYSYAMSEKWVSTFGTAYDLGEHRNRGQSLTLTRVGADFLIHLGASFDQSKNNANIGISIEPRFLPLQQSATQLGSLISGGGLTP